MKNVCPEYMSIECLEHCPRSRGEKIECGECLYYQDCAGCFFHKNPKYSCPIDGYAKELIDRLSKLSKNICKYTGIKAKQAEAIENDLKSYGEARVSKWLKINNENYSPFDGSDEYYYICRNCRSHSDRKTKYCPDCGFIMINGKEAKK